jgi:hypothetical protein
LSACQSLFAVYPETKGVPLEEMDTLFGEGKVLRQLEDKCSLNFASATIEERLDNESERTSLISSALPTSHRAAHINSPKQRPDSRSWFSRLLNRDDHRATYEPIQDHEE